MKIKDYAAQRAAKWQTNEDALLASIAAAQWLRSSDSGIYYGAGRFFNVLTLWKSLVQESRKAALRLMINGKCFGCGNLCPITGEGDHMIASSVGGTNGLDNWAPSCNVCNLEKGIREPVEFLLRKGVPLKDVDPDFIVHYSRYAYKFAAREGRLWAPPPEAWVRWLLDFADSLPSEAHKDAFRITSARYLPVVPERPLCLVDRVA